jgi:energy-converting hydrogenase Eha subunit A
MVSDTIINTPYPVIPNPALKAITMRQLMWHADNNTKLGFIIGALTGMSKYILNFHLPLEFPSKLVEAGITAAVCGMMGVAGKELWVVGKRAFVAYFKNRKSKRK